MKLSIRYNPEKGFLSFVFTREGQEPQLLQINPTKICNDNRVAYAFTPSFQVSDALSNFSENLLGEPLKIGIFTNESGKTIAGDNVPLTGTIRHKKVDYSMQDPDDLAELLTKFVDNEFALNEDSAARFIAKYYNIWQDVAALEDAGPETDVITNILAGYASAARLEANEEDE
jgi:hypothetical protein